MDPIKPYNPTIASAKLSTNLKDSENIQSSRMTQEEILRLLSAMMEASAKESRAQHKRFLVETVLSVIAIVVASIAAIASVAVLNPALANALRELIL